MRACAVNGTSCGTFAYPYTLRESDEKILRCQLFPTVQAAMDAATPSTS